MSLRSRIAEPPSRELAVKSYGGLVPESIRQGEIASQMTPASPFSPGQPIGPYDGYSRTPRAHEYVPGYNIAARPRLHERVSFDTLRGLVEAYDIAQLAIWHRIDSLRSLEWKLVPADHFDGDASDAIKAGMAALARPDRINSFETWLAKWLYDVLAYDAGCLYRLRNRAGRCVGLMPVDGTTIAPLLDYWGNPPAPPAESHVQYVNGLPWNWLTRDDLIYEPYRPVPNSPYGRAPLESIILNANTDIRFQIYFLQRFTDGTLPAAFASAPESWSPDQIEQFQELWDAAMYGDQSRKHQVRWMPPGSKFVWSNEKDFSDVFSLFMMRKSLSAYHVVPADMGFTENVNRSSGESQADVQHRIGDMPLSRYVSRIITSFVQDDLGLPLKHQFDLGEEQDDRLALAQADQYYMDRAVVSPTEIRQLRYGLTDREPVPRVFFTARSGPIPIASLLAVAGEIDPQTAAPVPGSKLPHEVFGGTEGVLPNPPIKVMSLAEQQYGEKAMPPAPPPQPILGEPEKVAKDSEAAAGITCETGIYGDPLIRDDEDGDEAAVAKELARFRKFVKLRKQTGEWRDFVFTAAGPVTAHNLNDSGRLAVRKAAGEVAVAGLAVRAADTGRVLMLQRALCDDDPAAGKIEFPGGHIEDGESPLEAAWREWSEETGAVPPPGTETGSWVSPDGIYQGIVWTTAREASVPVRGDAFVPNPDDPDGDAVEAILWFDPADLPGNPAVRAELLENIDAVLAALGLSGDGRPDCCGADCCAGECCDGSGGCRCGPGSRPAPGSESACPCGTPVIYDEIDGWQHADGSVSHDDGESVSGKMAGMAGVAKAADAGPKDASWPGWAMDLRARSYWAPFLAAALAGALSKTRATQLARAWLAEHPPGEDSGQGKREAVESAAVWLASQNLDFTAACTPLVLGMITDACLIGAVSAAAVTDGQDADTGGWQPGDQDAAQDRIKALGLGAALGTALERGGETAEQMSGGYLTAAARALVDGTAQGLGAAAIGASLVSALTDPDTAGRTVLGLLATGIGAAALVLYLARKVQMVRWVTDPASNVCAVCAADETGSPYRVANAPGWPAHPACRCAVIPA